MAQSKIGGTKSFIHGKVGSEVYYTDHDLDGEIIQVVKSIPDTVRNPRTAAQNRGRIIMATLYKAVGALAPLVNHSFEGYKVGRPSLAHFFSENYKLIKEDIEQHPNSGYKFGLVSWKGLYPRPGAYKISEGSLSMPSVLSKFYQDAYNSVRIRYIVSNSRNTIQWLKQYFGFEIGDFLTIIVINKNGSRQYAKLEYVYDGDLSRVLDDQSFFEVFNISGNLKITFTRGSSTSKSVSNWTSRLVGACVGVVLTQIRDGVQSHSSEVMSVCTDVGASFHEVLSTYPDGDKYYY